VLRVFLSVVPGSMISSVSLAWHGSTDQILIYTSVKLPFGFPAVIELVVVMV
jgi:hypothetical protein